MPTSISYIEIDLKGNPDVHSNLISAIDLDLFVGKKDLIPFVPLHFSHLKKKKRLFFYGLDGTGKTRYLLEVVKFHLCKCEKLYLVNPQGLPAYSAKTTDLDALIKKCSPVDMLIWDNFPDCMNRRDEKNTNLALSLLSSASGSLYVSLSSRHMAKTMTSLPKNSTLTPVHFEYSILDIKKLLATLGSGIPAFRQAYLEKARNRISKISKILWEKEPTPRAVLNYLQALTFLRQNGQNEKDFAVDVARNFSGHSEYYNSQFTVLKSSKGRQTQVQFLYTLKLCYDLELDKSFQSVARIQKTIFEVRVDKTILDELANWLYVVDGQISLHDLPGRAVVIDDVASKKIFRYLARTYKSSAQDDNRAYRLGLFAGRNLHAAKLSSILPANKDDVRNSRYYQVGLGYGIGEIAGNLSARSRRAVLESAERNHQFARNLGEGLGWNIRKLPEKAHSWLFRFARRNTAFSRGFGTGVGMLLINLPSGLQKEIFLQAEKNIQFTDGLGVGVGSIIEFVPSETHPWLFSLIESNADFARGLGTGLGHNFVSLPEDIKEYALEIISRNPEFARGLGLGLGDMYAYLPEDIQVDISFLTENNIQFAGGFGTGTGYSITYFDADLKKFVSNLVDRNPEYAHGAGIGLGLIFSYLDKQIRKTILKKIAGNQRFATGLGEGLGFCYALIPRRLQDYVMSMAGKNTFFARGLGVGIGYGFQYLQVKIQSHFLDLATKNSGLGQGLGYGFAIVHSFQSSRIKALVKSQKTNHWFREGLGEGFGSHFGYLSDKDRGDLLDRSVKDIDFARGLGYGFGVNFSYTDTEIKDSIMAATKNNPELSAGFKEGLLYSNRYNNRKN